MKIRAHRRRRRSDPDAQMQQALDRRRAGDDGRLDRDAVWASPKEMALWDTPFLVNNVPRGRRPAGRSGRRQGEGQLADKGLVGLVLLGERLPQPDQQQACGEQAGRPERHPATRDAERRVPGQLQARWARTRCRCRSRSCSGRWRPRRSMARRTRTTPSCRPSSTRCRSTRRVTNHVYSPWIVTVSKKFWDGLSKDEQAVLQQAAVKSRDFERKDTRDEAAKALAELKTKGMAGQRTGSRRDRAHARRS